MLHADYERNISSKRVHIYIDMNATIPAFWARPSQSLIWTNRRLRLLVMLIGLLRFLVSLQA